jgi:hypothetical protein
MSQDKKIWILALILILEKSSLLDFFRGLAADYEMDEGVWWVIAAMLIHKKGMSAGSQQAEPPDVRDRNHDDEQDDDDLPPAFLADAK